MFFLIFFLGGGGGALLFFYPVVETSLHTLQHQIRFNIMQLFHNLDYINLRE